MSRCEIKNLKLFEVSHVEHPANRDSRVALWKTDETKGGEHMDPEELAKKLEQMEKDLQKSKDDNAELAAKVESLTKSAEEAGLTVEGDKIVKSADVEYVEIDGEKIAKSTIPAAVLAKLEKADAEAKELRKKAQETEILKRANEIVPNMVGGDSAKIEIVKMLDAVSDETVRKSMTEALKSADEVLKSTTKEMGDDSGNGGSSDDAGELDKMVDEYAKSKSVTKHEAYSAVIKTAEGRKLAAAAMTKKTK